MESMLNREWRGAIVSVATDSTGVGFLRRKTNPFMERKENHMIIARAAKGAALLLMIFGVVALIGCQPAAGVKGDKGDTGDKGATGATGDRGPQGEPGPGPLVAKGGIGAGNAYTIVFNGEGDDTNEIGALTTPSGDGSLDLSERFSGGVAPLKFKTTPATISGNSFKVEVDEDTGMATVTKETAAATEYVTGAFTDGITFTVTATDANETTAVKHVTIKANRKPRALLAAATLATDGSGLPIAAVGPVQGMYIVGTQEAQGDDAPALAQVAWNTFEARHRNNGAGAQVAAGRGMLVGANAHSHWVFEDEDPGDVTVAITGDVDNEYIMAELDGKTGALTVTGVKSTFRAADADADPPVAASHVPVPIEITATDSGGLTVDWTIHVWVDGAPVAKEDVPLNPVYTVKLGDGARDVVGTITSFFEDPEGHDITAVADAHVSSANELVATVAIVSGNVQVTPVNLGRTTITVYGEADTDDLLLVGTTIAAPVDRHKGTGDTDGLINVNDGPITAHGGDGHGAMPGPQYGVITFDVQVIP